MKYLKRYNEGIVDWAKNKYKELTKDSEEDVIAKRIIEKIEDIDPEDVSLIHIPGHYPKYAAKISHITTVYVQQYEGVEVPDYKVYVSPGVSTDDELLCSYGLSSTIFNMLKKIYKEEQNRLRLQRIDTNIS